jgi:hypothetical protein
VAQAKRAFHRRHGCPLALEPIRSLKDNGADAYQQGIERVSLLAAAQTAPISGVGRAPSTGLLSSPACATAFTS